MAREQFHNDLKPYAILMAGVFGDLENMTEDELLELSDACEKPTQTNCWFYTYQAARFIGPLVSAELSRRGVPPNALAQADAACGVSPGAMG